MLASTDGLPGPLKLNRFGSRGTITPRNVTGPSAQSSDSLSPPGPTGSIRVIAPVNASKPVAKTSTSHGYVTPRRAHAVRGDASIGSRRRFTSARCRG